MLFVVGAFKYIFHGAVFCNVLTAISSPYPCQDALKQNLRGKVPINKKPQRGPGLCEG